MTVQEILELSTLFRMPQLADKREMIVKSEENTAQCYESGDQVVIKGHPVSPCIYIVGSGRLEVRNRDHHIRFMFFESGEIIGELEWLLSPYAPNYEADIVAVEQSWVARIKVDDFKKEFLQEYHSFAVAYAVHLAHICVRHGEANLLRTLSGTQRFVRFLEHEVEVYGGRGARGEVVIPKLDAARVAEQIAVSGRHASRFIAEFKRSGVLNNLPGTNQQIIVNTRQLRKRIRELIKPNSGQ